MRTISQAGLAGRSVHQGGSAGREDYSNLRQSLGYRGCFKIFKQHLWLEKEAHLRDYDGLVGYATVVMIRYMFLSVRQRLYSDQRTAGSLFHGCCEEVRDLTLLEPMQRLMALVITKIRSTGEFAEDVVGKMIDAMMGAAVEFMEEIRSMHNRNVDVITS